MKKRKYLKLNVSLKSKDKQLVRKLSRSGIEFVRLIKRAQILKLLGKKVSPFEISIHIGVTIQTVYNIGRLYQREGLNRALYELPRPGRKPLLNQKQAQNIIAMVCSDPPSGYCRWSIRLITVETINRKIVNKIGRETIRILLQCHDIKPWREKMWCIPKLNDEYIKRMEDLLELYDLPYNPQEPVICLDERPLQLLSDLRASIPMRPGRMERKDYEYKRCGTANAFCAVEPKAGHHITKITRNKKGPEFGKIVNQIAGKYPAADTIHLVMDNYSTHTLKSMISQYGEQKGKQIWNRFTIHYTPVHGSWLNQAEIEISIYSHQCLGKRRIGDINKLKKETRAWNKMANKKNLKINLRFTVKDARRKFKYYKSNKESKN